MNSVKRRYRGFLNGLSDLCRSQIAYNILLEQLIEEKEIDEASVPLFPENKHSYLLSLVRKYNSCLDELLWIDTKMMNVQSPNGREYICKIYNSNPYSDQKLHLIVNKKTPCEERLKETKLKLFHLIKNIQNEITELMCNDSYSSRIDALDEESKAILFDIEIVGLSIVQTAKKNGYSMRTIRRRMETILDTLTQQ